MKKLVKPEWHAPWKLMRVISGHLGWVRAVAMDPTNKVFNYITTFNSGLSPEDPIE